MAHRLTTSVTDGNGWNPKFDTLDTIIDTAWKWHGRTISGGERDGRPL